MTKASTFPAIPKTCSPQQAKYLRDRLQNIRTPSSRSWRDRDNEPAQICDARKLIEKWESAQRKAENKRYQVYHAAETAARQAILFKSPDVAIAAVEAYEKLCREAKLRS